MKTKTYLFKVSSHFSSREINARTKTEAKQMFLKQVPTSKGETLKIV